MLHISTSICYIFLRLMLHISTGLPFINCIIIEMYAHLQNPIDQIKLNQRKIRNFKD